MFAVSCIASDVMTIFFDLITTPILLKGWSQRKLVTVFREENTPPKESTLDQESFKVKPYVCVCMHAQNIWLMNCTCSAGSNKSTGPQKKKVAKRKKHGLVGLRVSGFTSCCHHRISWAPYLFSLCLTYKQGNNAHLFHKCVVRVSLLMYMKLSDTRLVEANIYMIYWSVQCLQKQGIT